VLGSIGTGIQGVIEMGEVVGTVGLLWLSAIASAVTDNIPLAAVLAKILSAGPTPTPSDSALWWSVIFGANLGGNITPIGSASTVVAVTLMQKNKLAISFGRFVKYALPFAAIQLVLATAYILIFF
jgi:Na+/H+ antiporter NhaD/arsenite permease-like protein